MMNQMERTTGMDLNGDGRIGGGMGQPQQYNQFSGPGSQGFTQYSISSTFQTGPQFGGHGFAQNPLHGGGSMLNQMENMTGVDLNGDGRVGGSGQDCLFNQHSYPF
jgi:hypothetical protein